MIGSVAITLPDDTAPEGTVGTASAILADDGTWSFEGNRFVGGYLRQSVSMLDDDDFYAGPSGGPYGHSLLRTLAGWYAGSTLVFEPKIGQPAGTIY